MIVHVLPILLARLAGASWADAETVNLQYGGAVDLAPFACQDVTRSSVVNRVCYDAASRRMIVQANAAYSQYCGVPEPVRDSLLNAPSMGQYYRVTIKGSGTAGPYECRAQRMSSTVAPPAKPPSRRNTGKEQANGQHDYSNLKPDEAA